MWAVMPAENRKTQRKPIAERLYAQGFTMEAIATQLGVSVETVSQDLKTFSGDRKMSPDQGTDTLGRKKSTGRPRWRRSPRSSA
jgi:transposase